MLLNLNQQGQQTWLTRVKNILQDAGLINIWQTLGMCTYPPETIEISRVRLQDQYTQRWCSLLQAITGKLRTYKQLPLSPTYTYPLI